MTHDDYNDHRDLSFEFAVEPESTLMILGGFIGIDFISKKVSRIFYISSFSIQKRLFLYQRINNLSLNML